MPYRGMNGTGDSLVFGGWQIALIAVGIGAAWAIIGQTNLNDRRHYDGSGSRPRPPIAGRSQMDTGRLPI
jgi:hypothetical protein